MLYVHFNESEKTKTISAKVTTIIQYISAVVNITEANKPNILRSKDEDKLYVQLHDDDIEKIIQYFKNNPHDKQPFTVSKSNLRLWISPEDKIPVDYTTSNITNLNLVIDEEIDAHNTSKSVNKEFEDTEDTEDTEDAEDAEDAEESESDDSQEDSDNFDESDTSILDDVIVMEHTQNNLIHTMKNIVEKKK